MALQALILRKKIDLKEKELSALKTKAEELEERSANLEEAINEAAEKAEKAETEEEKAEAAEAQKAVEDEVENFETEKAENSEAQEKAASEVERMKGELKTLEEADSRAGEEAAEKRNAPEEQKEKDMGEKRDFFEGRTIQEREALFQRDDVKGWIGEIRAHITEKRDLTNIGLTIPDVFLGYLRENVKRYSKLYKHVNVQRIGGKGREVIMGSVPEGVWTECCAALNELSLSFNDVEVDCFKVGGYFKVCNAILEDSDIQLASLLLDAIGQAIGFALDKAILYGRNTATNQKMPQGVMSRLVQDREPAGYPATAREWQDLSISNVISIPVSASGIEIFKAIVMATGNMKHNYSRGTKVWVMNETTFTKLVVEAMSINAAGAIVSGQGNTMPIVGGTIELLDFVPDNVIIGGYFDLYLLAERAGQKFATSEHVFFLNDQTAFKGTARYDGLPVIPESFIAIGLGGITPDASMTFAPDDANDADLDNVEGFEIDGGFSSNITSYNVEVSEASSVVTATPVKADARVIVEYNGKNVVNGTKIKWEEGASNLAITCRNGNAVKTYVFTVRKV